MKKTFLLVAALWLSASAAAAQVPATSPLPVEAPSVTAVPAAENAAPAAEPAPMPTRADFTVIIDASSQMDEKKGQAVSSLEAAVKAAVDVAHVGVPVVSAVYWKDSALHPLELSSNDHRTLLEKVRGSVGEAVSVVDYIRSAGQVNDSQRFIIVSDGSILQMDSALFERMVELLGQRRNTTIDFLIIKKPLPPVSLWTKVMNMVFSRAPERPRSDTLEGLVRSLRTLFPSQVTVWAAENDNVKVQLNRILTLYKRIQQ